LSNRLLPIVCIALALTGCKFGGRQGNSIQVTMLGQNGFLQIQSASGITLTANYGTLRLRIVPRSLPLSPGETGLPRTGRLPAFASAMVTAQSPSAMKDVRTVTLTPAQFEPNGQFRGMAISKLPQASDMGFRVYLRDEAGQLVGSGEVPAADVHPGPNDVTVEVAPNADGPLLLGASDNINVSDGVVVKGASLELRSGFAEQLPGVSRVEVEIEGPAYARGDGRARIASLEAPGLAGYIWRPIAPSGDYEPTMLVAGNQPGAFNLVTRALDPFGQEVGINHLPLKVVGTAYVNVDVDDK
jgi:hypothetical protein